MPNTRRRIAKLERVAPQPTMPEHLTDSQWVERVAAWHAAGTLDFSTEPDFAQTLAKARESVSRGECQIGGDSPLVRLLKMTRRVMRGQESSTPA
ncbi:MAG: hypothetical protein JO258_01420 [Alphaproteobacteria bacterium]|nr:hypothetical protein [Alphaproteobacteria bacterium]